MKTKSPRRDRNGRTGAAIAPVVPGAGARTRVSGAPGEDARSRALFDALRIGGEDTIAHDALPSVLREAGIRMDDPRLAEVARLLAELDPGERISFDQFERIANGHPLLIERVLTGQTVLPEFASFSTELDRIHAGTMENRSGSLANYIPQLERVDPDRYGVSVCTVDGQRHSIGDANVDFCIQSICKTINYVAALEEHGEEEVHRHMGCEPSGRAFNELWLGKDGRPHNPLINAGGIMSTSLVQRKKPMADRFEHIMDVWRRLAGGTKPGFSTSTYLSERETADRNFALAYSMRENRAFPEGTNLVETLELYFQSCSIEMTADSLAIVAGTLAGGGVCPVTGERVLRPDTVQKVLSLMYSCGMYDFSGQWAFSVGLPAKSGVSGGILLVVPNVMGLCVWSPRLDENGNSVRGIAFCRELTRTFNFHNYDNLLGGRHDKIDPRQRRDERRVGAVVDLCWAASRGDLRGVQQLAARGVSLGEGDYDGRTALHLAASEGHVHVVEYLLAAGVDPGARDRWGGTPLDDARRESHREVARVLEERGPVDAKRGRRAA